MRANDDVASKIRAEKSEITPLWLRSRNSAMVFSRYWRISSAVAKSVTFFGRIRVANSNSVRAMNQLLK